MSIKNKIAMAVQAMPFKMTAAVASFTGVLSSVAHAQNLATVSNNVLGNLQAAGNLVVDGAMLGGVGSCASGLLKWKEAADSNGQVKYTPGTWRIVVGSGLVGLPMIAGNGVGTFFGNSQTGAAVTQQIFVTD